MSEQKFTRPLRATFHCRHYSYERSVRLEESGPRCALGIDLTDGPVLKCLPDPVELCESREDYRESERAAWAVWQSQRMKRLGAALQALPKAIPLRSGGHVDCPSCGGQIRYDRWEGGAELHCSTEDCCGARFNIARGADWPQP
jgi:hypothetical protein